MADAEAEVEADRFSSLPFKIKICILAHLKIKDAVRTSALARSWRNLWTHLPCLNLCNRRDRLRGKWTQRAYHLVSSLQGPLHYFQLDYYRQNPVPHEDSVLLQSLLDLLPQKGGVEKLDLIFDTKPLEKICLPSFHSLYVLNLSGCHVVLPTGFQGFRRLKTLSMHSVGICNDELNLLVRTSKNLTSLVISKCHSWANPLSVELSLPFLRHLEFYIIYQNSFEKALVVSAPCLKQAVIGLKHFRSQNSAQMMLRLVTSVTTAYSLKLSFDVLRCFSLVALPFNFTFPCLRCLTFPLNMDANKQMCDVFLWLLRSMPFLEELQAKSQSFYDYQAERVTILMKDLLVKKHDGFACLEGTLTSVTIYTYCMDVNNSIAIIQFFLLNAKVLKLLKIHTSASVVQSMIEELQKAEVTSSHAKVMISDDMSNEYYLYDWN
ncbi:hypothetical protein LUZ61_015429 [Rhynchospora tenuis]|uniref:F-box domain-containing protein n=1 Tax=Rhynchospora tenuis TaxID=198213 RepID=A0AAD5WD84_9POAL|nr:hypothetical protein LUZ61_015429 [Rhynchospora tenuis]